MKTIKLVSSIMMIMLLTVNITLGQRGGDRGAMLQKRIDRMAKHLELNDAQKAKIQAIFEDGAKKRQAIMAQEGDRASKKKSVKALMEAQNQEIEKVLTKEQLVKFNEIKQKRRGQMEGRRGKMQERKKKGENKEMKAELKQYSQDNIMPVLKQQRAKLDDKMSEADKNTIDELRASFKARKQEMIEVKKNHKGKKHEDFSDDDKAKFKAYKEATKADMKQAKTLAEKYQDEIKALREEIKPQAEQWKADMAAIFEKYGAEKPNRKDMKKRKEATQKERKGKKRKGKAQKRNRRGMFSPAAKAMSPIGFLRLDPNAAAEVELDETPLETAMSMKIFPNPAQDFNNIQYTIVEAGDITIELHDQEGKLVKTVVNQYQEAGTYTQRVNLGDLKGYVYMYVLKDNNGSVLTEQFVVRK